MQQKQFSVILLDMCPLVSGITTRDAALSVELGMQALDLAVGRATLHSLDGTTGKCVSPSSLFCGLVNLEDPHLPVMCLKC